MCNIPLRKQFPGDFPRNSTKTANKRSYLCKLVKKKPGFPKKLQVDFKFLKTVMAVLHVYSFLEKNTICLPTLKLFSGR